MLDRSRSVVIRHVALVRLALLVTLGVLLASAAPAVAAPSGSQRSLPGVARAPRADQAPPGRFWSPGFALETVDGLVTEPATVADTTTRSVVTPVADVDVVQVASEQWELVVRARAPIASVTFPWRSRASALDTGSPSTVLLYPAMLGVAG